MSCVFLSSFLIPSLTHSCSPIAPKARLWFLLSWFMSSYLPLPWSVLRQRPKLHPGSSLVLFLSAFDYYLPLPITWPWSIQGEKTSPWIDPSLTSVCLYLLCPPTIIIFLNLSQLSGRSSAWTCKRSTPQHYRESCVFMVPGVIHTWNKLLCQIALNCASRQSPRGSKMASSWRGQTLAEIEGRRERKNTSRKTWWENISRLI